MHMALVILGGGLLLAVFALFGRLWGHDMAGVVQGLRWFVPVWALVALVNMGVGVTKAGYTVAQEAPILAVVFLVPAVVAGLAIWHFGRGKPWRAQQPRPLRRRRIMAAASI